jgi:hypothetical protein
VEREHRLDPPDAADVEKNALSGQNERLALILRTVPSGFLESRQAPPRIAAGAIIHFKQTVTQCPSARSKTSVA